MRSAIKMGLVLSRTFVRLRTMVREGYVEDLGGEGANHLGSGEQIFLEKAEVNLLTRR